MSDMDKNPQAMTVAFKKCKGKILKIKELGITPDMASDDVDTLIEKLATAKFGEDESKTMAEHIKGQRWYVEGLVKFSGLTLEEQLQSEYDDSFADSASEAEMLEALRTAAA